MKSLVSLSSFGWNGIKNHHISGVVSELGQEFCIFKRLIFTRKDLISCLETHSQLQEIMYMYIVYFNYWNDSSGSTKLGH